MPDPMKPPKAVLFDLYNTLIDIHTDEEAPDVWERMALFFSYQGVETTAQDLRSGFRAGVLDQQESPEQFPEIDMTVVFRRLLGGGRDDLAGPVCQLFRALSIRHLTLFPDTLPGLQALQGEVRMALVSDAQRLWLEPELRRTGLADFFEVMIVSSDHGYRKPDPRMFQMALKKLKLKPEETVFIGDSAFRDVGGAQSVGIRGCLLTRHAPFEAADALVKPDFMFPTLLEFVSWIQGAPKVPARG